MVLLLILPLTLFSQKGKTYTETTIPNALFKVIHDTIASKVNRGAIPSFSVAVSKSGSIIWQQSFGWADKTKKRKATPATVYPLASLSKTITTTALLVLAEKGLIRFTDSVAKYLGKSKLTYHQGASTQLTISHLTNMTGGIPHQWEYLYRDEKKQPLSFDNQLKRYGIVVFPPGQVFLYSNFSPAIAEQIIRNVTRKNLTSFLKETVFAPLNMKDAAVNRTHAVAKGYNNKGQELPESEFYPKGGGGYYASVNDLIHYGMFQLKDKTKAITPVLSDSSIDFLHSPVTHTGRNKFYANGWGVMKMPDGKTSLLSNGAIDGAASSLLLLPDSDIAIACLTNATVGNDFTDQIAFSIADALLPGYLQQLENFVEVNASAFSDQPFQSVDSLTGTWEGKIITYRDSIPVQLVFHKDGKIVMQIQNQLETLLNNPTVNSGLIQGQCYGNLLLPEIEDIPQYLEVVMKPGKNKMYGSISAQSFHSKRPYFLIPAYLDLNKKNL